MPPAATYTPGVSFTRGIDGPRFTPIAPDGRAPVDRPEQRRAIQTTRLGDGTLACPGCDAPVAIGPARLSPAAGLACPFCGRRGPLRDFLSLAAPARPARVVVTVTHRS
jgi:hypothetical protein